MAKKQRIRSHDRFHGTPFRQERTVLFQGRSLTCPCGTLLYQGPKPRFSRISCPTCKGVFDVPPEFRHNVSGEMGA